MRVSAIGVGLVVLGGLAAVAGGCASLACRPQTVLVDVKEERTRLESEFRGMKQDPSGRLSEIRRDRIVPEYWVRDRDGAWHQVSESEWRDTAPGKPLEVCR
jgi:hypothetical protein